MGGGESGCKRKAPPVHRRAETSLRQAGENFFDSGGHGVERVGGVGLSFGGILGGGAGIALNIGHESIGASLHVARELIIFVHERQARHEEETLVTYLAELVGQRAYARVQPFAQRGQAGFLAVVAAEVVAASVDVERDAGHTLRLFVQGALDAVCNAVELAARGLGDAPKLRLAVGQRLLEPGNGGVASLHLCCDGVQAGGEVRAVGNETLGFAGFGFRLGKARCDRRKPGFQILEGGLQTGARGIEYVGGVAHDANASPVACHTPVARVRNVLDHVNVSHNPGAVDSQLRLAQPGSVTVRVGINGFGRIGRLVARAVVEYGVEDVRVVAVNSPGEPETSAHLLRYDSVHGRFAHPVVLHGDTMDFGAGAVRMTRHRDPALCDWGALDVDVVMECTGLFRTRESVEPHITAGAKTVLISAPGKGEGVDRTVVFGVNHDDLTPADRVVSCASCTTNCLAPLAKVLLEAVGIKRGFMTTVHSYTQDQRILDNSHKDFYRARAAALNIIPTSTGAAKAVSLVIPELEGVLSGTAVRVPTANVSMMDLSFRPTSEGFTADGINAAVRAASEGAMAGVIDYVDEALVSSDHTHNPHSTIFAAPLTEVLGNLVKVVAWYDNEWGFANRMIDVARVMGKRVTA